MAMADRVLVGNEDLRSIRDASRELGRLGSQIEAGETDFFILTNNGRMVAALVPLDALPSRTEEAESQ